MTYNPDIHHRRSIRLKDYDYSQVGVYFVTICAWHRECLFGDVGAGSKPARIESQSVQLNEFGKLVEFSWDDLPNHNSGILLDAFVIMPNHVHFIVTIEPRAGLEPAPTLSEIVRQFKTFSAKRINSLRGTPGVPVWQRNYFERVVHDDQELAAIREYIASNPAQWDVDNNNTEKS